MVDRSAIAEELQEVLQPLGLELYDVELTGAGRTSVLRVLVDREGGVDLDAVSAATQQISPALDRSGASARLPDGYSLEVSSPGLERPLRLPAHFRRTVGETISVKYREPDGSARRSRGVVVAADDDGVDLDVEGAACGSRTPTCCRPRRSSSGARRRSRARRAPYRREGSGRAMNSDMMEALENIEREKGISVEIMLEALANALLTAYKRMPNSAEEALVEIDMETGAIKVIAEELDEEGNVTREWDDTPSDFGRIAAQTAKQVIFQRIREAEREMKYEEYAGREGDIVTGIIQQTDAALHAARPRQGRGAPAAG